MKLVLLLTLVSLHSFASVECDVYRKRSELRAREVNRMLESESNYKEMEAILDEEIDVHYMAWAKCFEESSPELEAYCMEVPLLLKIREPLIRKNVHVRDEYELGYLLFHNEASKMMLRSNCGTDQ